MPPTVFTGVTQDMRIANEEIFGPVLSVLAWSDEARMLAEVNAVPLAVEVNAVAVRGIARADMTAMRRALLAILANLAQDEAAAAAAAPVHEGRRISRPSSRPPSPAARSR
jgi:acyl-CoA reductase-like NAD-dependent aldehyde dehydrogenase